MVAPAPIATQLYQAFPITSLTRYVVPSLAIWILAMWGAAVVVDPVFLWLLRAVVVAAGFLAAILVTTMEDFFAKRFREPLLTLDAERIRMRDVELRWDEVSRFTAQRRFGFDFVGMYPSDPQALLRRLSPLQRTYYRRQMSAYRGALCIPPVRDMSQSQLLTLLNEFRRTAVRYA